MNRPFFLAAGGTGGHLFPAQALAEKLSHLGRDVHLLTDQRGMAWAKRGPWTVHLIPSASPSFKKFWKFFSLMHGYWQARQLLKRFQPCCVVGFGGYPSVPPVFAAQHLKIPTFLHEQNALVGRANFWCAKKAIKIASSFPKLAGLPVSLQAKVVFTGNPVRKAILFAVNRRKKDFCSGGKLRLFVFGGSQGAQFFSSFVPQALALLPPEIKTRLEVVQQCRPEDLSHVEKAYSQLKINVSLAPFFEHIETHMIWADLVVSRAGASSLSEICVLGCASLLVPLPGARDQYANAENLSQAGGALMSLQENLTCEGFALLIKTFLEEPDRLLSLATCALSVGKSAATDALFSMIEEEI